MFLPNRFSVNSFFFLIVRFTIKSPSVTQSLVSQENALKKRKTVDSIFFFFFALKQFQALRKFSLNSR